MLDKNELIQLTNRDSGVVGYTVPDLGIHRNFAPGETKEVTVDEIRKLSYLPGGKNILERRLVIKNDILLKEILGQVEPEYYYSQKEVENLLLNGSLDELLDCLDFAPEGVIDLIKDCAINLKIDNVSKRRAIQNKTGVNISKAIEINDETDEAEQEAPKTRRTGGIDAMAQRRVEAPKYKVTSTK